MEFLIVNCVLYILYISKIYNVCMYIHVQTVFGNLGVKHHYLKLPGGPMLPSPQRVSFIVHGPRLGAGAEALGAASQVSR